MIRYERQQSILKILEKKKSATIRELAQQLFASEASIRRDVETLEKQGFARKIYGGVLLLGYENGVVPVHLRDADHSTVKDEIAARAAALIQDGDTIIMDASSTVRRMIKHLGDRRDVTIITNNHRIFSECDGTNLRLYCVGGSYNRENHAFLGPAAEQYLRTVSTDLLFFSSQGITEDGFISDDSEEESALRRTMISRAKRQFFLCDSSKIGVRRTFTLCHKDDITGILCDSPLPWEEDAGDTMRGTF